MRDKEGSTQDALTQLLTQAKRVVMVQGEFEGEDIKDYADPVEVEERIKSLDISGNGLSSPVIQEAELKIAYRFDPATTQRMQETFIAPPSRLSEYMTGEQSSVEMKQGDLYIMMCDRVDESENEHAANKYGGEMSQSRIILGLWTKQ